MYKELKGQPVWRWAIAGMVVALVLVVFGILIWFMLELRPADSDATTPITYQLEKGTDAPQIADELERAHIIRSSTAFTIIVSLSGNRSKLQAGTYELNPSDSPREIIDMIVNGRISQNKLLVPEGATVKKIRDLVSDKGVSNKDFDATLAETYGNDFLAGRPQGDTSLEGYLFPDTYTVVKPVRPKALIQSMLDNFSTQVAKTDIIQSYATRGLTLHQGVTLASIVEKESGTAEDQKLIAQVFLKRLQMGMPLQSDVTVIYAADKAGTSFSTTLDSPYNTYANKGLPPGPIASPGISALTAVAHPAPTDYLYFLADKQGKTHFAHTAEEHNANIQKYLR